MALTKASQIRGDTHHIGNPSHFATVPPPPRLLSPTRQIFLSMNRAYFLEDFSVSPFSHQYTEGFESCIPAEKAESYKVG